MQYFQVAALGLALVVSTIVFPPRVDAADSAESKSTVPFKSQLMTTWGAQVTPETAWQEYPRPHLVRANWTNLNGLWDYQVTKKGETEPVEWKDRILVPYCLESKLSGVQRLLDPTEALWYHRTLDLNREAGRQIRLNLEAVDYQCSVWVNDVEVGQHVGGNIPFSFDITNAVRDGENHLVLRVEDATGGAQLRGKQRLDPKGIWYTRVSGIWQTVWLEEVPSRHIDHLSITTDIESGAIKVQPQIEGDTLDGEKLRLTVLDGGQVVAETTQADGPLAVRIAKPKLWSPSNPHLYDLRIVLLDDADRVVDQVDSYTGLRAVGKTRDRDGNLRFTLNNEVIFHLGPLDQGWWPDGLLTPPSDAAMRYEIEFLKDAGFNMIRKHIKVEPRRYYYHCDRIGIMVWQDHVSGGAKPEWTRLKPNPEDASWSDADHNQFMRELQSMIDNLGHFPSIVVWVPYNEAWGQHRTIEVGKWTVGYDSTRLVNIASGGNFWPVGHVVDAHNYPHPTFPFDASRFRDYVHVVGEFGGHGWPVLGHLWDASRRNWGYGGLPKTKQEYVARYRESFRLLKELKSKGIAGGVYTQTTDVEGEINGLMTYDRKVIKIPASELKAIHEPLFAK